MCESFEPRSHFKSRLSLTLKMTTAQVVETSVTVNNNSPIQDYVHPENQTQPTFENRLCYVLSLIPDMLLSLGPRSHASYLRHFFCVGVVLY